MQTCTNKALATVNGSTANNNSRKSYRPQQGERKGYGYAQIPRCVLIGHVGACLQAYSLFQKCQSKIDRKLANATPASSKPPEKEMMTIKPSHFAMCRKLVTALMWRPSSMIQLVQVVVVDIKSPRRRNLTTFTQSEQL